MLILANYQLHFYKLYKRDKLKIALIQPAFAHYRKALFAALHKNFDIRFVFLNYRNPYPSESKVERGWNVTYLRSNGGILQLFELFRNLFFINSDILITSIPTSLASSVSFFVSKIKNKKLILWSLNWNLSYEHLNRSKAFRILFKLYYKFIAYHSDALIVPGKFSLKYHKSLGIKPEKIFVANQCSIDLQKIQPNSSISMSDKPKDLKTILYFGRITQRKGLDVLIHAFKKIELEIDKVQLLVAGDGDFKSHCEGLAEKFSLKNIKFLGSISFENSADYFRRADVFVLPSLLRNNCEAWGLVINEAMSLGKAIVTTDAVGCSFDLVKNGFNGYIVKNGDSEELFNAIIRILKSENCIKSMGANSRTIFESFNDYDKMFKGFMGAIFFSTNFLQSPNKLG